MGVLTVLCVNLLIASKLLSVFSLSDPSNYCEKISALFISTPQKMEALSGSCLQIPCSFRARTETQFDSKRDTFGVWIRKNLPVNEFLKNVVYNSSREDNKYPMKITGNLHDRNCTTMFYNLTTSYSDLYYFRIMNWPFRATALCDTPHIEVKDSAWSPRLEIPGVLKEKQSVTITCSALTPCPHSPPQLTWSLQRDSQNNMEENTDGTFTTKIQETITLSDKHDGNIITCSAKYPVNEGKGEKTAEETKTLRVSYAPKDTSVSISPSGLVSAGEQVTLTCSSRANPPVSRFIWFKISKDGAENVAEGEVYSFTVTDGGIYYCEALNDVGNQTSFNIQLNTSESLFWVWVLGFVVVVLICLSVSIWWFKTKHLTPQQTQAASVTEDTIHYGEVNFSKRDPEALFGSVQDSGQQQETVYAEVKVSGGANSFMESANNPNELYAEVRKK